MVVTITHIICDNHRIISCYYTSSQVNVSFCHLTFLLFDDLMRLRRILTLNEIFILKYVNFDVKYLYVVLTDNNRKSGNIGSHSESQDGQ